VLPFDGFRQLSRAFEWDCGLEHPATAEALESVRLKSRLDVLSAVREGIQAATQAAYDRLRRHRVALRRRLGKEAEEMRKIQDHVESSRRILTRVESGLASLAGPIESLAKDMESLAEHVRDLPEAVTDLAQVAQRLLEMVSTLRTQEDGLASLRKACADIASRLAGDRGASPANTPPTGEGQPPPSADDQAAPDGESDQ
jgi:chromosome segregation ATPase